MTATELPKCLRKYARLIAEVSDERSGDDGYWVYLAPGYIDPMAECHCVHEDTLAECHCVHEDTLAECHCVHEDTLAECAAAMQYVEKCKGDCCK